MQDHTQSSEQGKKLPLSGRQLYFYLPFSVDLEPSDNHLFDFVKESLRSNQIASDKEVKTAVMK